MGLKAKYEAGKVESKVTSTRRDAQKAVSRASVTAEQRRALLEKSAADIETMMAEAVELPLAAPASAPAPAASGSQKRAREEPPSHDALVAAADEEMLKAGKEVARAEVVEQRAMKQLEQTLSVAERMGKRLTDCQPKILQRALKLQQDAVDAVDSAISQHQEAEIAHLRAQLKERSAENVALHLQLDHAVEDYG